MNLASPMYDASAAGALAGTSLCSERAPATAPASVFVCAAGAAPVSRAERRARWRDLLDTLLSPISGPTMPQA